MGVMVSGMNDVINSQLSSQAAWLNRIPVTAWALMAIIGIGCSWVIGFRWRRTDWHAFLVVPVTVSVCFFLLADRAGLGSLDRIGQEAVKNYISGKNIMT